jgi:hypothetical protein
MSLCGVRRSPPLTGGTPIEGVSVGIFGRRCSSCWWRGTPSWLASGVAVVGESRIVRWCMLGTLAGWLIWALVGPVVGLSTLVASARFLGRTSGRSRLVLDQSHNLGPGQRGVTFDSDVSECCRRSLGVANVSGRWPLFTVVENSVSVLGLCADILVFEFHLNHVIVGGSLFLETDV